MLGGAVAWAPQLSATEELHSEAAQASIQALWLREARDHAQQLGRAAGLDPRPTSTIGCGLRLPRFSGQASGMGRDGGCVFAFLLKRSGKMNW